MITSETRDLLGSHKQKHGEGKDMVKGEGLTQICSLVSPSCKEVEA